MESVEENDHGLCATSTVYETARIPQVPSDDLPPTTSEILTGNQGY